MNQNSLFLAPVITVLFFGFAFSDFAEAASTGLTIQPIKISETIEPSNSKSGVITLSNASSQDVKVDISVEDFVPTYGSSNINFVGRAQGNTTVRDWIEIDSPESFVFENGAARDIRYTINAPENAEPGSHFGVIFFKATEIKQGGQLKIGTRVGVLVFITIPGNQLQKGKILDFKAPFLVQGKSVPFKINFENTGTVHFEPKGTITVKNIFGKETGKVEVSGQSVLPTGSREITASLNSEGFLLGRYTASLSLVDGEGNELSAKDINFYAFPIKYILIFLGGVLLIFIILRYLKKKVNISIT